MAQRIALHYVPGRSALHRWDARCKILGLFMVMATLLTMNPSWLLLDSTLLLGLAFLSRLPLRGLLRGFRVWVVFLSGLFLVQAFLVPGTRIASPSWLPVTREGLRLGGMALWRLSLILGYAILFTAVTRPRELRDILIWALKPFPFLRGHRLGLMVSLTLRFFSLLLDQTEEVSLAQKARLGDQGRHPVRRIKFLALPILRRSILWADDITLALVARGYREDGAGEIRKLPWVHALPPLAFLVAAYLLR